MTTTKCAVVIAMGECAHCKWLSLVGYVNATISYSLGGTGMQFIATTFENSVLEGAVL